MFITKHLLFKYEFLALLCFSFNDVFLFNKKMKTKNLIDFINYLRYTFLNHGFSNILNFNYFLISEII